MLNEIKSRFLSGKRILVILVMLVAINANAQWVQMSNGIGNNKYITSFAVIGNNIFAGITNNGVFLSTNNGLNWSAVNNGLPNQHLVHNLTVSGTNLFVISNDLYLSTNNGTSWETILTGFALSSFAASGSNLYVGGVSQYSGFGMKISTNYGTNWTTAAPLIYGNNYIVTSIVISGTNIIAGTNMYGVYLSTNNGSSWISANNGITNLHINSITVSENNIYACTWGGVYLSTNNGTYWSAINNGLTDLWVNSITVSESDLFAATGYFYNNGGVFLSTNNGTSWVNKNQGFISNPDVLALLIANNYIFAGTSNQSVWCRSLSELIGIQNISTEAQSKYSLSQNYPNPFNPTTNIKFSIVNAGEVKLVVYDIQGREVRTLVNESLKPGTYEAAFDGSGLNSGIYFYKLVTNGFTETKKMLMIK